MITTTIKIMNLPNLNKKILLKTNKQLLKMSTNIYVTPQDLKALKVIKSNLSNLDEYKKNLPSECSKKSYEHLVDLSNILVEKQLNASDQTSIEVSDFATLNEANSSLNTHLIETSGKSGDYLNEFLYLKKNCIELLNNIFITTNSAIIESLNVTYQNIIRNNGFTATQYDKIGNIIFDWVHNNVPVSCAVDLFNLLNKLAVSETTFLTAQHALLAHTGAIITPLICITVGAINTVDFKKFCTPVFLQNWLKISLIKIQASASEAIPLLQQNLLLNSTKGHWKLTTPFASIFNKFSIKNFKLPVPLKIFGHLSIPFLPLMFQNFYKWYYPIKPVPKIKAPLKENLVSKFIKGCKEETVPISRAAGEFCEENLTAASSGLVSRSNIIVKTAVRDIATEVLDVLKDIEPKKK